MDHPASRSYRVLSETVSIAKAVPHIRQYELRPCGERGPSVSLCLSLASRPCNCTEMHPATRELERVYNESEGSSDSRWFTVSPCPLERPTPFLSLYPSRTLSLITSLFNRYLLLSSYPPIQPSPSLVCPSSSTTAPVRATSGVTLNSGPAATCPTTRVDKARPMHEAKSKESLARKISKALASP